MTTWARPIESLESLPEVFVEPYRALVSPFGKLPYTVFVPPQSKNIRIKPVERLLCETGESMLVFEHVNGQVITSAHPYADIVSFELGYILLYSWFSINTLARDGTTNALAVEFNQANLRHFEPFFRRLRPAPEISEQFNPQTERAKFEFLSNQNFKYMNFALECLLPGERVIQSLYQPTVRLDGFSLFGHVITHPSALSHLLVLTESEIILIGEADQVSEEERGKYGGVWRFLPLNKLLSVSISPAAGERFSLRLAFSPNLQLERQFDSARLPELEKLQMELENRQG